MPSSYKARDGSPFSGIIGRTFIEALLSALLSNEVLLLDYALARFILTMLAELSRSDSLGDLFSFISAGVFLTNVDVGLLFLSSESG